MTFAINIDPHNPEYWAHPDPTSLYNEGFRGVRYTSFNNDSVYSYTDACKAAGLKVLAIVTGESQGYLLPQADIIQVENEPDIGASPMTPAAYADRFALYRNTYPQFVMYTAGLASGDPTYLRGVLRALRRNHPSTKFPNAIAIHPYNKTPSEAASLFDQYWNVTTAFGPGIPIVATEWYRDSPSGQIWDFQCMLNNPTDGRSRLWNSFFCYSDVMVSPLGLRTADGTPKDEYYSLLSAPCR